MPQCAAEGGPGPQPRRGRWLGPGRPPSTPAPARAGGGRGPDGPEPEPVRPWVTSADGPDPSRDWGTCWVSSAGRWGRGLDECHGCRSGPTGARPGVGRHGTARHAGVGAGATVLRIMRHADGRMCRRGCSGLAAVLAAVPVRGLAQAGPCSAYCPSQRQLALHDCPDQRQLAHAFALDSDGLGWTRMDSDGLEWTRMDSDGLRWTRMDSDGLGWYLRILGTHA